MTSAPRWGTMAEPMDQASSLRVLAGIEGLERLGAFARSDAPPAPKTVVIASGKGGVGKSSLAVNLGVCAAQAGVRTVVVDADMGLANADVLCGMTLGRHLGHVLDGDATLDEVAVEAPGGFRLVSGSSGVARMAVLDRAQRARVMDEIRSLGATTDLVIVDCGAGIGPTVLEFLGSGSIGLVVTTPEPTAITDAYALIKAVVARAEDGRGRAGVALVVNQARSEKEGRAVHERIDQVARKFLDRPVVYAGVVREDDAVANAVRARWPMVLRAPRSRASKDIRSLSGVVMGSLDIRCDRSRTARGVVSALRAGAPRRA